MYVVLHVHINTLRGVAISINLFVRLLLKYIFIYL